MAIEQSPSPDYILDTAFKAAIPSVNIYTDPSLRAFYEDFQREYRQPDSIERNRGGIDITYAEEVYDGISLDGRHMFSVRMPKTVFGTVLADTQRYFVVSGDFETKESTEWWLHKVEDKTLYLCLQPISEVPQGMPSNRAQFSLDAIMQRRYAERERADADYSAIRLTIGNGASISWGDGKRPESLLSFSSLSSQLDVLAMAEKRSRDVGSLARAYTQDESDVA